MQRKSFGTAFSFCSLIIFLIGAATCKPVQRSEPKRIGSTIEKQLPADCRDAIRIYISNQEMRQHPEKAVREFRRLSLQYSYQQDSAAHAVMKCYEGQAWDVLHTGDSMLACYEDAGLYLEAHPELIDMRAMCYLFTGWAHDYKNQRLTANYYFNKAGNELEDTSYVANGNEYYSSDYPLPTRAALLTEIAENAQSAGLKEQARHYIQRALHSTHQLGDSMPDLQAFALIDAGLIYTEAQRPDSGAAFFNEAYPLLARLRDTVFLIAYYDRKGACALLLKNYDSSVAFYSKALQLQEAAGVSATDKAQTSESLAAGYLALGRKEDARKAIERARPVFATDSTAPLPSRVAFSRTYLKYLLAGTDAARVFDQFITLSDSAFGMQRINTISDMDAQYGLQKKEARIGRLNTENESFSQRVATQQTLLVVSVLVIAFLAILIAFLRQLQHRRRLESERNKAVLEQQLLRSQMEPHFIFNTISVLQSLIRKDEKERSVKYLSQFARLLRISLENAREAFVPLSDEIEALQHYLSLQQVRFQDVFTYDIETYEGYEAEAQELLIPPMLLQPFVENAIQHGMAGKKNREGRISIHIQKEAKTLRCTIADNGTGQHVKKDSAKKNSLSTIITRERLDLLSRQSGTSASLTAEQRAENKGGGMLITLVIPFRQA